MHLRGLGEGRTLIPSAYSGKVSCGKSDFCVCFVLFCFASEASRIPSLPPRGIVAGGGGGSQGACAERPLSIRVSVRAVQQVGRREMATG